MDLIVRGGRRITDPPTLQALRPGQTYPIWRGSHPRLIRKGERVYFMNEQGGIYLHATYAGYKKRRAYNLQGVLKSAWAILVTGPVTVINPPFLLATLNPSIVPNHLGPWPKRYDRHWNLRQYI
jgi:hypothetical protein